MSLRSLLTPVLFGMVLLAVASAGCAGPGENPFLAGDTEHGNPFIARAEPPVSEEPASASPAGIARWPAQSLPVLFCLTSLNGVRQDVMTSAVLSAASVWRVPIRITGICKADAETLGDGENAIGFGPLAPPLAGQARLRTSAANEIVEADIVIEFYLTPSAPIFRNTLAHELGHALGLDHSTDVNSIMYPIARSDIVTVSRNDAAAIARAYPEFWRNISPNIEAFLPSTTLCGELRKTICRELPKEVFPASTDFAVEKGTDLQ